MPPSGKNVESRVADSDIINTEGTSIDQTTTTASPIRSRASISAKSPEELINQAKHMASDLIQGSRSRAEQALARAQDYVDHSLGATDVPKTTAVKPAEPHTTAVAASSLPSQEKEGAKPGDYSTGAGALPGSVNESSVAVLPEEKKLGGTLKFPLHQSEVELNICASQPILSRLGLLRRLL